MKIVDFPGKDEADDLKPMERLRAQLDHAGLDNLDGEYLLLFDTGESLVMLSNFGSPGEVLLMTKKAEMAIMATQFEPLPDAS